MPNRWIPLSNRLRMTYSLRSKASAAGIVWPRPMKTWNMAGSAARAVLPTDALLVGTGRQPRRCWPSSSTIAANSAIACVRARSSREAKKSPAPDRPRPAGRAPGAGGADAQGGALVHEELVRDLDEDAGAVAGIALAAAGAAVVQVLQGGDAVLHQLVRLLALELHDEADAAAIVLVARVV